MNNFRKPHGTRPGARSKFGAGAPRTSQSRPPSRMGGARDEQFQKFDAVCSNCGKACQVPFRPDGKKPVYCKNCFGAPREALPALKRSTAAAEVTSTGGKTIADLTRQIAAMNTKIDTMLKILEEGQ